VITQTQAATIERAAQASTMPAPTPTMQVVS
jgi:hypothetical protein